MQIRSSLFSFIAFCWLIEASVPLNAETQQQMSVQEVHRLSSKGELFLVDIRSVEEWKQTGLAPQAIPMTIHQRGGIPQFSKQLLTLLEGDKNKRVAVICAGGVRSARVQKYLKRQGFSNIIDVNEGMIGGWFTQGWIEQGLPVKPYKNQ